MITVHQYTDLSCEMCGRAEERICRVGDRYQQAGGAAVSDPGNTDSVRATLRYQFQPWPVRMRRWLRYMPLAWVRGAWSIAHWFVDGAKPLIGNRRTTAFMIWRSCTGNAAMKMEHWWTLEEVERELGDA